MSSIEFVALARLFFPSLDLPFAMPSRYSLAPKWRPESLTPPAPSIPQPSPEPHPFPRAQRMSQNAGITPPLVCRDIPGCNFLVAPCSFRLWRQPGIFRVTFGARPPGAVQKEIPGC